MIGMGQLFLLSNRKYTGVADYVLKDSRFVLPEHKSHYRIFHTDYNNFWIRIAYVFPVLFSAKIKEK